MARRIASLQEFVLVRDGGTMATQAQSRRSELQQSVHQVSFVIIHDCVDSPAAFHLDISRDIKEQ